MEIKCLGKLSSLLAPHTNTFIPCTDNSSVNCQGAYLSFDNNKGGVFVRSGEEVARQGFVEQDKESYGQGKKGQTRDRLILTVSFKAR